MPRGLNYDASHRPPLTMRFQPLCIGRIRDLCVGDKFTLVFETPDSDLSFI